MTRLSNMTALLAIAVTLSSCKVGPDYSRASAPKSLAFKEASANGSDRGPNPAPNSGWKQAAPSDALAKGDWWTVYKDPILDGLEKQVATSNQTLKQQEAAFRQARAIVEQARANLYPTFSVGASASRSGTGSSGNGSSRSSFSTFGGGSSGPVNDFGLTSAVSWDVDLWGRIRRTVESDVASAQAYAADVANARLSAQSELATDYFGLRVADETQRLLDDTVRAYQTSLDITSRQYRVGVVARSDVIQAQTQLQGAQAQQVNIAQTRAQYEHAIATLIGKAPSELAIARVKLVVTIPDIPAGLPSALLERRPDISAAERRMAMANAEIGVAIAAYYPDFTISASGDFASTTIGTLLHASNLAWSVGGSLSETIFDAGQRGAVVEAARAVYDQNIAVYRATVLAGFQQVEDQLSGLRVYARELAIREADAQSAQLAVRLLLNQYRAGTVSFTSVVTAQATALNAEEAVLTVRQNQLTASVTLIQALGGGWQTMDLPDGDNLYATKTGLLETASAR